MNLQTFNLKNSSVLNEEELMVLLGRLRSELRSDRLAEDKHRQRMEPGQGATPAAQGKGKGGGGGAGGCKAGETA